MSTKGNFTRSLAAAGASALLVSTTFAADKEVQLSEVPAAVKATIEERVKGATIEEIELEDEDGRQIYSVEFVRDGKEVEIEIATNGDFLGEEVEDDKDDEGDDDETTGTKADDDDDNASDDDDDKEVKIDPASAPEAVKAALKPLLQGATIKALVKETENGKAVYEAEYDVDGLENSIEVSEDGTVLEVEREVPLDKLPDPVKAAATKNHEGGVIKSAELVEKKSGDSGQKFYEIKVQAKGKMHEVKVDVVKLSSEDDD